MLLQGLTAWGQPRSDTPKSRRCKEKEQKKPQPLLDTVVAEFPDETQLATLSVQLKPRGGAAANLLLVFGSGG